VVDAQAVHTWTRRTPSPVSIGLSFPDFTRELDRNRAMLYGLTPSYTGRHFTFSTNYNDFSPNFCTELGFVNRIDIRQNNVFGGYFWRPDKSKIIDFGPAVSETVDWNHAGILQDWGVGLGFSG